MSQKKILSSYFFVIVLLFMSCDVSTEKSSKEAQVIKNVPMDSTLVRKESPTSTESGKEFLIRFYTRFYGDEDESKATEMKNSLSTRLQKRIDSLWNSDQLLLDYDPFIQGQDFDGAYLVETLNIKPTDDPNNFEVHFYLLEEAQEATKVESRLVKQQHNWAIDEVLGDDFLDFNRLKNIKSLLKEQLAQSLTPEDCHDIGNPDFMEFGEECSFSTSDLKAVYTHLLITEAVEDAKLLLKALPDKDLEITPENESGLLSVSYKRTPNRVNIEMFYDGGLTQINLIQKGENTLRQIIPFKLLKADNFMV